MLPQKEKNTRGRAEKRETEELLTFLGVAPIAKQMGIYWG
jgi:hypothetical protein